MSFYSAVIFPRLLDRVMQDERFTALRRPLLADLTGDVLEVGFGTGLNLPHYPSAVVSLTTIEPNEGMNALAKERIANSSLPVKPVRAYGEQTPFPDSLFDAALSTWTLCSVTSVQETLAEVARTLKPGGRFYFVEHGLSDIPSTQVWQQRLNPIQRFCADGCNLNRNFEEEINRSPLRLDALRKFHLEKTPGIISPHYLGLAIKP